MTISGLALSAFVVACGDDDTTNPPVTPGTDSGTDANRPDTGTGTDSGGTDSGGTDAGSDADAAPPIVPAKLQLVNAATDFGPNDPVGALRICYKVGTTEGSLIWATLPPLPNRKASDAQPFPGVYAGTGGPVDGTGVDLTNLIIRPYVISALALQNAGLGSTVTAGNDKLCGDIIDADAGGPFVKDKDYWVLPDIPAQTFKQKESYLLALTGCTGDSTKTEAQCGAAPSGTPGNGNLAISIFKIDNTTTVTDQELGVQVVSLSPNIGPFLQAQPGGGLPLRPGITNDPNTPANAKLLAPAPGDVTPKTLTTLVKLTGVNQETDRVVVNPNVPAPSFTLGQVAALSFGTPDAAVYSNGKTFTFVAVGDISADPDGGNGGATFNTKFFHFLALPNDPAVKAFDGTK